MGTTVVWPDRTFWPIEAARAYVAQDGEVTHADHAWVDQVEDAHRDRNTFAKAWSALKDGPAGLSGGQWAAALGIGVGVGAAISAGELLASSHDATGMGIPLGVVTAAALWAGMHAYNHHTNVDAAEKMWDTKPSAAWAQLDAARTGAGSSVSEHTDSRNPSSWTISAPPRQRETEAGR